MIKTLLVVFELSYIAVQCISSELRSMDLLDVCAISKRALDLFRSADGKHWIEEDKIVPSSLFSHERIGLPAELPHPHTGSNAPTFSRSLPFDIVGFRTLAAIHVAWTNERNLPSLSNIYFVNVSFGIVTFLSLSQVCRLQPRAARCQSVYRGKSFSLSHLRISCRPRRLCCDLSPRRQSLCKLTLNVDSMLN